MGCSSTPKSFKKNVQIDKVKLVKKGKHHYLFIKKEGFLVHDYTVKDIYKILSSKHSKNSYIHNKNKPTIQIEFEPILTSNSEKFKGYSVSNVTLINTSSKKDACGVEGCIKTVIIQPYKLLQKSRFATEYLQNVVYFPSIKQESIAAVKGLKFEWGMRYKVKARYYQAPHYTNYKVLDILQKGFSPVPFFELKGTLKNMIVKQLDKHRYLLYNELEVTINDKNLAANLNKLIQESKKEKLAYSRWLKKNKTSEFASKEITFSLNTVADWEKEKIIKTELVGMTQTTIKRYSKSKKGPCNIRKQWCEQIMLVEPYQARKGNHELIAFFKYNKEDNNDTSAADKQILNPNGAIVTELEVSSAI